MPEATAAPLDQHNDGAQEPRLEYVMCASPAGTHRMAYWEWGDPRNGSVLLCVHGLTRTGRDFDVLARRLSARYRVVCPDIAGRGRSDWLINAASYVVPQYVGDILTLIARLAPRRLDWVGTSMGGLIGLGLVGALAMSQAMRPRHGGPGLPPEASLPFGKFVLNDIGPALDFQGLKRIGSYVGEQISFDTFDRAVDYVRSVSEGFGQHDRLGWEELTRYVFVQQDGRWIKHYDLRIAEPMLMQSETMLLASENLLWNAYENIPGPVLILRGEKSDLLSEHTAQEMLRRNRAAVLHTVPGVGHAPTLRSEREILPIEAFLSH